jgi:hypothetical protein
LAAAGREVLVGTPKVDEELLPQLKDKHKLLARCIGIGREDGCAALLVVSDAKEFHHCEMLSNQPRGFGRKSTCHVVGIVG